jgi:antitoxin VapB
MGRSGVQRVEALHPICYPSTMAMNIKDPQTEALAAEVAALANETKTQLARFALEDEAWPQIPEAVLGRPVPKAEREAILGYGSEGV